jgi:hypothetical protein
MDTHSMKKLIPILLLLSTVCCYAQTSIKDTLIYKNQTRPDTVLLDASGITGTTFRWEQLSGPVLATILSSTSKITYAVGNLAPGSYQFKLTVDSASDTMNVFIRDWQQKNISPCRQGGGKSFVLQPSAKGIVNGKSWYTWNIPYMNKTNYISTHGYPGETIQGGDTLYFQGNDSASVELGDFGGGPGCPVFLMAKDAPVVIRYSFFRVGVKDSNVVQYAVVDGTNLRGMGYAYGWQQDNSHHPLGDFKYSNLVAGWVTHFTVNGVYGFNTQFIQIKLEAGGPSWKTNPAPYGMYDKFIERKITLNDLVINHTSTEALYIGHTASDGGQSGNPYGPPPRMDSVTITNCFIQNTGWDGIQLANCRDGARISNNFVYNAGVANVNSQRCGIFIGANGRGAIDSNIIVRVTGDGLESFGYDTIKVFSNIVDSAKSGAGPVNGSMGIFQKFINVIPENNKPLLCIDSANIFSRIEKTQDITLLATTPNMRPGMIVNNLFIDSTATNPNKLVSAITGTTITGNKIRSKSFNISLDSFYITSSGWIAKVRQGNASITAGSVKVIHDWLVGRTTAIAPIANAGSDQVVILPGQARLIGSGTDSNGLALTYKWTKIDGPVNDTLVTPDSAYTNVNGLVEGIYKYRLTVSNTYGVNGSDDVQLTVVAAPSISSQPQDLAVTYGDSAIYSVTASGTSLKYQWQVDIGTGFKDITDSSKYSGFTTNNLIIAKPGVIMSGYKYHCKITGYDTLFVYSSDADLAISPRSITVAKLVVNDKVYDGLTTATLNTDSTILLSVVSGDSLSLSSINASAFFADKNVGFGKPVTISGFSISGLNSGNYILMQPSGLTTSILPISLTLNASISNKVYDGKTSATISSQTLNGVLNNEAVQVKYVSVAFVDKNAGTGKSVVISGLSLIGLDSGNYSILSADTSYADISPRSLIVGAMAQNKIYDGERAAVVSFTDNRISGDNINIVYDSANFVTKDVGTNKIVNISGIRIAGIDSGNYILSTTPSVITSLIANITVRSITVSANNGQTKIYSDPDPVLTYSITNGQIMNGDSLTGSLVRTVGEKIGSYSIKQGSLTLNSNYILTFVSKNFTVTPKLLIGTVSIVDKTYNGTTVAGINTRTLIGVKVGDSVTLQVGGAVFSDPNAGTGKMVTVTGLYLGGSSAFNYKVNATTTATANIVQKKILLTPVSGQNKIYGTADPVLRYTLNTPLITGDSFAGALSRVSGENVGTYKILLGTLKLNSNYILSVTSGVLFTIVPTTLTISKNSGTSDLQLNSSVQKMQFDLKVVPNPTNSQFTLKVESEDNKTPVTIKIVNEFGIIINMYTNLFAGQTLEIGGIYRPGIYLAQIRQGRKQKFVKLIKLPN